MEYLKKQPAGIKELANKSLRLCIALAVAFSAVMVLPTTDAKAQKEPKTAAVFDFEFVNWSQEKDFGVKSPVEEARTLVISDLFRELLTEGELFELRDTSSLAEQVASVNSLRGCNGCEAKFARQIGADVAIIGIVNKVSNMELAVNVRVSDAKTGKVLNHYQADLRGNTDESWDRTIRWIVKNRIKPDH